MAKKRWNNKTERYDENQDIDKFIDDIIEVCKMHGLSISHEDGHGGFEIEKYSDHNADWLREASDSTGV